MSETEVTEATQVIEEVPPVPQVEEVPPVPQVEKVPESGLNGHVEDVCDAGQQEKSVDEIDTRRESVSKEPPPTVAPKPKRPSCKLAIITWINHQLPSTVIYKQPLFN